MSIQNRPDSPFIGREDEFQELELITRKKIASLVVVKGRRRIGKSRLLIEFAKQHGPYYRFTGLSPEEGITAAHQRADFAKKLQSQFDTPPIASDDWDDLFAWLGKLTSNGKVIILLDEITWMAMDDPTFLPKLKNAWDDYFSKNPQLVLILCGSVSVWIEKNILSGTGFFGRIASEISLDELSLPLCHQLLKKLGFKGSSMELFMILCLTGGVPWYLELINPTLSASENIKRLCFTKDGILTKEYDKIFHDLFGKRGDIYSHIVSALASGPKEYSAISEAINYPSGGPLSEYLGELTLSGFIRRDYMWNFNTGEEIDISIFRLSDNYLRFYLKNIAPNLNKINKNQFKNVSLSAINNWSTILGLQFESLVLNNREIIWKKLLIDPAEIINDNPYLQRKTTNQRGCQIDYLIQTKFNILYIFEVKISQNTIGMQVVHDVKEKIERLVKPKKFACKPVLIHAGDVSKDVIDSGFFAHIINFNDLVE